MSNYKFETIPLDLKKIRIDDNYWNRYTNLIPDVVIPYQWEILNDRVADAPPSHCLKNFSIAAGEATGERGGVVFQDSDVFKWLEAVAYSLAWRPNPKLEETADQVIALLGRAQADDGYLNTYYTLVEPNGKWKNLTAGHELYCAGHLFEAAVAYYQVTGKRNLLDISCRFANLICKIFGPNDGQLKGYPGHPEIELALIKLYNTTGNKNYLELSKFFIDIRGRKPNYFLAEMAEPGYADIYTDFRPYDPSYSQSHLPVREQSTAEGHSVRATYLYCAMADLAHIYDDAELLERCKILWENLVNKRMYIVGSIGSSDFLERFTTDYDLPNDIGYCETCASIGLALFGSRMAKTTKDASYIEIVERALYNNIRSGISLDGNKYFYVNPLEVWPENCKEFTSRKHVKPVRQKWFDVACCPTNVARTLTSLGNYIYAKNDNELFVNLFIQNTTQFEIRGKAVDFKIVTDYPRTGNIAMEINSDNAEFDIFVRIPEFAKDYTITLNDAPANGTQKNGYYCISGVWNNDKIKLSFKIEPQIVYANPLVRANTGKVAIMRGPEVYCFEETDNTSNLASIFLSPSAYLEEKWADDLLGGTMKILCKGSKLTNWNTAKSFSTSDTYTKEAVSLTAIPYGSWSNRNPGEMIVWVHSED